MAKSIKVDTVIKTDGENFEVPRSLLTLLIQSFWTTILDFTAENIEKMMKFVNTFSSAKDCQDHFDELVPHFCNDYVIQLMKKTSGMAILDSSMFEKDVLEFLEGHVDARINGGNA